MPTNRTVLATIVSIYELELNYGKLQTSDAMRVLFKQRDECSRHLSRVEKELKVARDQADAARLTGPKDAIVVEIEKKIEAKKSQLAELSNDLRRSEDALKKGREACMEYIGILEGSTNRGYSKQQDRLSLVAYENRMIEELKSTIEKRKLRN